MPRFRPSAPPSFDPLVADDELTSERPRATMYQSYYRFSADPFRLTPDPNFSFEHKSYAKAKLYLKYALGQAEGFVLISGAPGVGKTTLIDDLLVNMTDSQHLLICLESARLDAVEFLRSLAFELDLEGGSWGKATLLEAIEQALVEHYREGRRALIIVDEAQELTDGALTELRLLSNLRVDSTPVVQVFLLGQEDLRGQLTSLEREQLHQRLITACHLEAMAPEETRAYVEHRLHRAGWDGDPQLDPEVFPLIHRFSRGVPRCINLLCNRLLVLGFIEKKHELGVDDVGVAIVKLQQESLDPRFPSPHDLAAEQEAPRREELDSTEADDGEVFDHLGLPTVLEEYRAPVRRRSNVFGFAVGALVPLFLLAVIAALPIRAIEDLRGKLLGSPMVEQDLSAIAPAAAQGPAATATELASVAPAEKEMRLDGASVATSPRSLAGATGATEQGSTRAVLIDLPAVVSSAEEEMPVWPPGSPVGAAGTSVPTLPAAGVAEAVGLLRVEPTEAPLAIVPGGGPALEEVLPSRQDSAGSLAGPAVPVETFFERAPVAAIAPAISIGNNPPVPSGDMTDVEIRETTPDHASPARHELTPSSVPVSPVKRAVQPEAGLESRVHRLSRPAASANVFPAGAFVIPRPKPVIAPSVPAAVSHYALASALTNTSDNDHQGLAGELESAGYDVEWLERDRLRLRVGPALSFAFGSEEIPTPGRALLDDLLVRLRAYPGASVNVIGHSDNSGPRSLNLEMSRLRAASVAAYLQAGGLSRKRLRTEGRGAQEPRYPNDSESSRELNRRVEIEITPSAYADVGPTDPVDGFPRLDGGFELADPASVGQVQEEGP